MTQHEKVQTFEALEQTVAGLKREGKKIVLCHGCFDLFHPGHLQYLREAASMGDVLVVTVSPDRFVDKGPLRPRFDQWARADVISAIATVDYVAINEWATAVETIERLKPDVYVKGADFKAVENDPTGKLAVEAQAVEAVGGRLAFTTGEVHSSTRLINTFLSPLPDCVQQYLARFRRRYSFKNVTNVIEAMRPLKAVVVGDAILDEYNFCNPLGASSKDAVLAVKHSHVETYAGGAAAIANHMAALVDEVVLACIVGTEDDSENFLRSKLDKNVRPVFVRRPNAPTVTKCRIVEAYSNTKLFEIYRMDDSPPPEKIEREFAAKVSDAVEECDLVVASDFGHGCISQNLRELLITRSPFLAVNTQANAGNRGLHTISRYRTMDYACMAVNELKLEMRSFESNVEQQVLTLAERIKPRYLTVTTGKEGCLVHTEKTGIVSAPAYVLKVVDRVGSGDALLSITAPAARLGVEPELLAFLGNVMGGLAVEIMGNREPVTRSQLETAIRSLLK